MAQTSNHLFRTLGCLLMTISFPRVPTCPYAFKEDEEDPCKKMKKMPAEDLEHQQGRA
jgi:hypothetical protein